MKTLLEIEQYAQKHFVPIARKEFVSYLKELIDERFIVVLEDKYYHYSFYYYFYYHCYREAMPHQK